jgi:hypothetical protein
VSRFASGHMHKANQQLKQGSSRYSKYPWWAEWDRDALCARLICLLSALLYVGAQLVALRHQVVCKPNETEAYRHLAAAEPTSMLLATSDSLAPVTFNARVNVNGLQHRCTQSMSMPAGVSPNCHRMIRSSGLISDKSETQQLVTQARQHRLSGSTPEITSTLPARKRARCPLDTSCLLAVVAADAPQKLSCPCSAYCTKCCTTQYKVHSI